jgi:hypothetical protein
MADKRIWRVLAPPLTWAGVLVANLATGGKIAGKWLAVFGVVMVATAAVIWLRDRPTPLSLSAIWIAVPEPNRFVVGREKEL